MHSYVPTQSYQEEYQIDEEAIEIPMARMHPILFGGDQLTAARARGAKKAKINSFDPCRKLDGLIPTAADWHARLNFLGVG